MTDPEKITIIEGPAPTFEFTLETWLPGMVESPSMPRLAMCRVRTSDGSALVERCHRAWRETRPAYLQYHAGDGTTRAGTRGGRFSFPRRTGRMLHSKKKKSAENEVLG